MISIEILAFILLFLRVTSIAFISLVIFKQVRLFRTKINFDSFPDLSRKQRGNIYVMRRVLFILAVVVALGNMVPIAIDTVALLNEAINTPGIRFLGVVYAISNAVTSVLSAFMIWFLYKLAGFGPEK